MNFYDIELFAKAEALDTLAADLMAQAKVYRQEAKRIVAERISEEELKARQMQFKKTDGATAVTLIIDK